MKEVNDLGFVYRFEPSTQPGAPALLLLHGSGGDETSLLATGRAIAPGAALLSPRGKATDYGSPRFYARPGNPSGSDAEIQLRTTELAHFARAACARHKLTPLILVGFSNGANMAVHLLLHSHMKWDGAVLMRGMAAESAAAPSPLALTPVLILSGIEDPLVQSDQAGELADQLRQAGADVTLHWEEAGHNLSQGDILMAFDWLRRFYSVPRPAARQHSKLK
jgi:phospholipase/carboxylesterase